MIPTLKEVIDGLNGAWLLAMRDPDALRCFNTSAEGFWKSFWVILLGLPVWLWLMLNMPAYLDEMASLTSQHYLQPTMARFLLAQGIAYLLGWILFPVIMHYVARLIDASANYVPFVVARNWALLLSLFILSVPPSSLYNLGIIGAEVRFSLELLATALGLIYLWQVTVVSLKVPGVLAVGLVSLDFFLTLVVFDVSGYLSVR